MTGSSAAENSTPSTTSPAARSTAPAASVDQEYAQLLRELVNEEGLVRYKLLAGDARMSALKNVIDRMAAGSQPSDQAQRLALLCNAYNANALLLAFQESRQPEFKTVNDSPGFFDARTIKVAGKEYTLKQLKDEIRSLRDPRIHCALVWGATSCPPLLNEPYSAERLDSQLSNQCRRWIEDRSKNLSLNMQASLSQIFNDHLDDFKVEPYGDYTKFVYKFAQPNGNMRSLMKRMEGGLVQVSWQPFNWSLNQARDESSDGAAKEPDNG